MRLLPLATLFLAGCPSKTFEKPTSVGPVPEVIRKDDFISAHGAALRVVLTELRGVELSPAARRLLDRAEFHAQAIGAAVPPPSQQARKAVEAMQDLPVVLEAGAKFLNEQRAALDDKARKQAAKDREDAVKQARLDTLSEVFVWFAGLAGAVGSVAAFALGASFVFSVPGLLDARKALVCLTAVSALLVACFSGAVLSLNYPWVFGILGAALLITLGAGAWYFYKLPPPAKRA